MDNDTAMANVSGMTISDDNSDDERSLSSSTGGDECVAAPRRSGRERREPQKACEQ